jgi:O-antigen/teichoic acid export membrane protein
LTLSAITRRGSYRDALKKMATNSESVLLPGGVQAATEGLTPARGLMLRNVSFGLLDYMVQPLLMLGTARYFIRHLGMAQFGVWMLVLAVIGSSGTLCTGFGDAALKYVAVMRGRNDHAGVVRIIESSFTLNFNFGVTAGIILYAFSPWASSHVFRLSPELAPLCIGAIRVGAFVLIVRSVAFVFISTLRAFENYRAAVQITSLTRIFIIVTALILIMDGHSVVAIMAGSLAWEVIAVAALVLAVRNVLPVETSGNPHPIPRNLVSFGAYSWFQALSGTMFSQADRLLVAALLGPAALAYYGICIQASQPIHGLAAAGLNVIFPHLSVRLEQESPMVVATTLWSAAKVNVLCVLVLALPLLVASRAILNRWMGSDFSSHAAGGMSLVALSFAFLAFNIPGHYALMAFGQVRYLTGLNLVGATISLLIALALIPHFGIAGAAIGRLAYGPITWLVYPRLSGLFRQPALVRTH